MSVSVPRGKCVLKSLVAWKKLRKAGAVRVKGYRHIERKFIQILATKPEYHYWVENKGMVFDDTTEQKVFRKDEYYRINDIQTSYRAEVRKGVFYAELDLSPRLMCLIDFNDDKQFTTVLDLLIKKTGNTRNIDS